jgi:hypothetical protein
MKPTKTKEQLLAAALMAPTEAEPFPKEDLDGTVYLPEVRRTSYAMNSALLCCALFGISKGISVKGKDGKAHFVRQYIERTFLTTNGAIIEYRGKELGQDDLTVLLGLLQKHSGMATSCEIEFFPTTFCSEIGWSDSDHNTKRLKSCLLRLRGAFLIIKAVKPDKDALESKRSKLATAIGTGWTLGFVSDFRWEGLQRWALQIDHRIGQLFQTAPTYLITTKRKSLTEGLQTWLYGYIEANNCAYAVPLETIHRASGSTAQLNQFARQVRDAIPKLVVVGTLRDCSTVKNGKVALFKIPSARPNKSA